MTRWTPKHTSSFSGKIHFRFQVKPFNTTDCSNTNSDRNFKNSTKTDCNLVKPFGTHLGSKSVQGKQFLSSPWSVPSSVTRIFPVSHETHFSTEKNDFQPISFRDEIPTILFVSFRIPVQNLVSVYIKIFVFQFLIIFVNIIAIYQKFKIS